MFEINGLSVVDVCKTKHPANDVTAILPRGTPRKVQELHVIICIVLITKIKSLPSG